MQKQNSELKAYKNGQKRAETELAKVKAEKRAANDEIKELKLKLSEKDGIILGSGHYFRTDQKVSSLFRISMVSRIPVLRHNKSRIIIIEHGFYCFVRFGHSK